MLLHHTSWQEVRSVHCLTKSRMHGHQIPTKVLQQTTSFFSMKTTTRNTWSPSGIITRTFTISLVRKLNFFNYASLRFQTVDDIKHMADTSNCVQQDQPISIHTEMTVTGGRFDPNCLILFPLLLG